MNKMNVAIGIRDNKLIFTKNIELIMVDIKNINDNLVDKSNLVLCLFNNVLILSGNKI